MEREDFIQVETYEDDELEGGVSEIGDQDESLNDSDGIEVLNDVSYSNELPRSKRRIR